MAWLIWTGAAISALGLCGILWSIFAVIRIRRAGLSDEDQKARMTRVLPVNLGALLLSTLGLMAVVIGIILQ